VSSSASSHFVYRFSNFEVAPHSGEVRKNGIRLKVQEQPLLILLKLLERADQLVTREELRSILWSTDTFVDFDNGLNMAIKRLREALGDVAERPTFVETVPRRGYRFIAPIERISLHRPEESAPVSNYLLEKQQRLKWVGLLVAFLALLGIGAWQFWHGPRDALSPTIEVVPLTGSSGYELTPSFSPDGNQVAFVLKGSHSPGIYTALVGGEKPLRLTSNPGDRYPRWSPDGRQIAFSRPSQEGLAIYLIPALGGTEQRVYSGPATIFPWSLDWRPDGKALAFSQSDSDQTHAHISLLSLVDSSIRHITSPSEQELDFAPAFSPDGSMLAFIRMLVSGEVGDLHLVPVAGGDAKRLTSDHRGIGSQLAWTADGSEIVFCSDRGGAVTLWRISISGGTPRPVAGVGAGAFSPAISPKGKQLVYQHVLEKYGIWQLGLQGVKRVRGLPLQIISAKGLNGRPDFSPDGKKVAFESDRQGYSEIWVCDSDGSHCGPLTSLHRVAGAARWSPDGRYIAFEFRPKDHSEVYVMDVSGGRPRQLVTLSGANNGGPSWSRDGKWIYFYSDQGGGPFQIWKVPFQEGPPIQVTKRGGVFALESTDRRFLYFSKFEMPGIWKMPIEGGAETRILDQPDGSDWFNWGVTERGIYFLDSKTQPTTIKFLEFATGQQFPIFSPPKSPNLGLAVSPVGRSLVFGQSELAESTIMLVKNFH
jgi:Tol biopolymer transport system component/DNA-binding winged helix-turn-helix (wHTH) protein